MPLYFRLLGGRIGKGCYIGTKELHLPDLIEIGNEASIGYGVELHPFLIEDGWLYLAPIQIGANAYIGSNSVIELGGRVSRGARLAEQSLVACNQTIPEGEIWAGSPSERVAETDPVLDEMATKRTPARWSPLQWAGFTASFVLLEILPSLITLPGLLLGAAVSSGDPIQGFATAPISGLLFVLTACTLVAVGKRLVMPKARPGIFPLHSNFGLRKWLADKLMLTSLVRHQYAQRHTLHAALVAPFGCSDWSAGLYGDDIPDRVRLGSRS